MPAGDLTGVIIRHNLLTYFPEVVVKAYSKQDTDQQELAPFFTLRPGPRIAICCFSGTVGKIELMLLASVMHFEFVQIAGDYFVQPKTTGQSESEKVCVTKAVSPGGFIDFILLAKLIGARSSAKMAMQLISV